MACSCSEATLGRQIRVCSPVGPGDNSLGCAMKIKEVTLYVVTRVKVQLSDEVSPTNPREAIESALELVNLDQHLNHPYPQGHVEHVAFEGSVLGGLAGPEAGLSHPSYIARDLATPFMDSDLVSAINGILSNPAPSLDDLLIVANGTEPWLSRSAKQGIVLHPDATSAQRQEMLQELADTYPEATVTWLETNQASLAARVTPQDIAPLLQSTNTRLREIVIRVLGQMKPRAKRKGR